MLEPRSNTKPSKWIPLSVIQEAWRNLMTELTAPVPLSRDAITALGLCRPSFNEQEEILRRAAKRRLAFEQAEVLG